MRKAMLQQDAPYLQDFRSRRWQGGGIVFEAKERDIDPNTIVLTACGYGCLRHRNDSCYGLGSISVRKDYVIWLDDDGQDNAESKALIELALFS